LKALCTVAHRLRIGVMAVLILGLSAIGDDARAGSYASIVMNAADGDVMYGVSADEPRYPASLTKMMTLYMTFEAVDAGRVRMSDRMRVSYHAASQSPSKLGLDPGDEITVENAVLALVTKSANDAAATLAEHLGGSESEFAERMTARARSLGMNNSQFRNASGLPDTGQVTTARDMATLAYALLHRFPHYYPYFSTSSFYYGGHSHPNHNRMLGTYDGVDGIKTGFINASGFNLVASAKRDGRRLIGVVFGARSSAERARIMTALLDGGFQALDTGTFVEAASLRTTTAALNTGRRDDTASARAEPSTWSVRIGPNHKTVAQAQQSGASMAGRAPAALAAADLDVVSVRTGKRGRAYAVQWSGLDRDDAAAACRNIRARGLACQSLRGRVGTVVASADVPVTKRAAPTVDVVGKAKVTTLALNTARAKASPAKASSSKTSSAKAVPTGSLKTATSLAALAEKGSGKPASGKVLVIGATKPAASAKPPVTLAAKQPAKASPPVKAGAPVAAPQTSTKRKPAGKGPEKQEALQACQKSTAKTASCKDVRTANSAG
jgi:D-alanyl-D-alanine carboxypeptidase